MPNFKNVRRERFREFMDNKTEIGRSMQFKPVACGKICFLSKSEAKKAVKRARITPNLLLKPWILQPYFCPRCDAWHIRHGRYQRRAPEAFRDDLS